jgi:hypothetical protein
MRRLQWSQSWEEEEVTKQKVIQCNTEEKMAPHCSLRAIVGTMRRMGRHGGGGGGLRAGGKGDRGIEGGGRERERRGTKEEEDTET